MQLLNERLMELNMNENVFALYELSVKIIELIKLVS